MKLWARTCSDSEYMNLYRAPSADSEVKISLLTFFSIAVVGRQAARQIPPYIFHAFLLSSRY